MPTNGFSIKPLKIKLLAGEQKATEYYSGVKDSETPPQQNHVVCLLLLTQLQRGSQLQHKRQTRCEWILKKRSWVSVVHQGAFKLGFIHPSFGPKALSIPCLSRDASLFGDGLDARQTPFWV